MTVVSRIIRSMGKANDTKRLAGWGARIRAVRKKLQMTQAGFAHAMGTGQASISRWENEEDEPLAHNWDRMAELSGVPRSEIRYGEGQTEPAVPGGGLVVRGYVQGGHWQEALEWPPEDWRTIAAPAVSEKYPGMPLFGLEVRGTSMNEVFPEGTILGCINLIHHPVNVTTGKFVIVERVNGHGEVEATVKEISQDGDGVTWLVPRSSDPRFKAPLRLDENDEVRIVAMVVKAVLDV